MTVPGMPLDNDSPQSKVFRKAALDRLSSPEQLDLTMRVTSPQSWIALAGLGLLLLAVVIWSFAGTIPTRVNAQGVIIRPGGVLEVYAQGAGPVEQVLVTAGETVAAGQVVARLAQPALVRERDHARARLEELERQHRELASFSARNLTLQSNSRALEKSKLENTVAFAEQRLEALRDQIRSEEALLEKGLITRQTVLNTRQAYFATEDLLEGARNDIKQLPLTQLTTATEADQEILQSQLRINEAERELQLLDQQLDRVSAVTSPYAGRVLEVKQNPGAIVGIGSALVSLELLEAEQEGLTVVAYVPVQDGKDVVRGMPVQVSPANVVREEDGFLIGRVGYVSEFPATPDGMMRVLGNSTLVQSLSAAGAPFAAYVELDVDPEAVSGYKWSSMRGRGIAVNSGTLCTVAITVRERRPVDLVIPVLRQVLGL